MKPTMSDLPSLPWTPAQAAKAWGISASRVKQLVAAGRVKHQKLGEPGSKRHTILIWQINKPDPAPNPRHKGDGDAKNPAI